MDVDKVIKIVDEVVTYADSKREKFGRKVSEDDLDKLDQEIKTLLSEKLSAIGIDDLEECAQYFFDKLEEIDETEYDSKDYSKLCEVHQFILYCSSI